MRKASVNRTGGALLIAALCLGALCAGAADVVLEPGDDLVQAVNNAASGSTLWLKKGADDPGKYAVDTTVIIDKDLTIRGETNYLPSQIEITGQDESGECPGNQVDDGDFEDIDHTVWTQTNPPDDPAYQIIQEDAAHARSTSHLANFKGIEGAEQWEGIDQVNVIVPTVEGLDEELTQSVPIPKPVEAIDELSQNIILPEEGMDDEVYLQKPFKDVPQAVTYNSAILVFAVARDSTPPAPTDRLEVYITDGSKGTLVAAPPLYATSLPAREWRSDLVSISLAPLGPLAAQADTWRLYFKAITKTGMKFYIDDIQAINTSPSSLIPLRQGSFDNATPTSDWNASDSPLRIVQDTITPSGPNDRCLELGSAAEGNLTLRFQLQLFQFSSNPSDQFEVLLGGAPLQLNIADLGLPTTPVIMGAMLPLGGYVEIKADLSGQPRSTPLPLVFRSKTTPSAANPEAPDENTTIFLLDDVCLMRGTPPACIQPPQAGAIPNGSFDNGPDGAWQEASSIPANPMLPLITNNADYNKTSPPYVARFGGLPPPSLSFRYKIHKQSGNGQDFLMAWFDGDSDGPDSDEKWMLKPEETKGAAASNAWALRKRWLLPALADDADHVLHFRGTSSRDPEESTFLVDDVCLSPYGGLNDCVSNKIADASFESYPGASSWAESVKVGGVANTAIRILQCYDPADKTCLAPDAYDDDNKVAMFGGLPPAVLRFWLQINKRQSTGVSALEVLIDNQPVATIPESELGYALYNEVIVPPDALRPFADNAGHTLSFKCKGEARSQPVEFLIDDVCLNPWGGLDPERTGVDCPENTVFDPGFEGGLPNAAWTETYVDDHVILEKSAADGWPAHTGDWLAKLNGVAPDIRQLTQEVTFPTGAKWLKLWVWTLTQSGLGADTLAIYVDDATGEPLEKISEEDFTDGWNPVNIPISTVSAGKHILIIQSATGRASTATQFLVDDICLSASTTDLKPILQIEPGNTVRIENVSITGGTIGILAVPGASEITVMRCYLHHLETQGVFLGGGADVAIAHSVVHNCSGDAIRSKGGRTNVYQCTLKRNTGYGVYAEGGTVNVIASLLWMNARGLGNQTSGLTSYHNFVYPEDFDSVRIGGDAALFRPPDTEAVVFLDSPWIGKLRNVPPAPCPCAISAETTLDALIESAVDNPLDTASRDRLGALQSMDFERDPRKTPLQVGADEVVAGANLAAWTRCEVTDVVPAALNGRGYDIVLGKTFSVEVEVVGPASLDAATIYVVPQEYQSYIDNDPASIEDLPEGVLWGPLSTPSDPRVGVAVFTVGATCIDHPQEDDIDLCLDGRARVYLAIAGTLYGIGHEEDFMTFDSSATEFIIDTTPPAIAPISLQSTAQTLVMGANDDILPPTADGPYPADWCAQFPPLAVSAGTLTPGTTPPPHVFFNNDPADADTGARTLNYTIGLVFWDTYPIDSFNIEHNRIMTAGFRKNLGTLNAEGAEAAQNLLFAVEDSDTGTAYWVPGGAATAAINGGDVTALMSQIESPYGDNGLGVNEGRAETMYVIWQVSGLEFNTAWHFTSQFAVTDIAGNNFTAAEPLHFWWMRDPLGLLTSAPAAGVRTEDPVFGWNLDRGSADTPQDAAPCLPIAQFRLWQAADPFSPQTTSWTAVPEMATEWSRWLPENTIDRNTLVFESGPIFDEVLQAHPGALLMITVRGADEAGNVQPLPNTAQGDFLPNLAALDADADAPPVAYAYWRNPGQIRALETTVQAQFWHNRTDDGDIAAVDPGLGEKDFGPSRRIPIAPADDCGVRIEGKFTIRVDKPDAPLDDFAYSVDWQLFQDGQLVAADQIDLGQGLDADNVLTLQIPQDLMYGNLSFWRNFLRTGPGCGNMDRLGDDGGDPELNRKRDVEYVFTARLMEENPAMGAWAADPTPAMVQFTVTVPETRKEEQPVKLFVRE